VGDLVDAGAAVAVVGAGLTVGTLFAFSAFIMSALVRLSDAEGVRAMQQINKTVYTPWFMGPFFGTTLLSVGAIALALMNTDQGWWLPLFTAGLLFVVGVFGVTAVGNVPLNKKLAGLDPDDAAAAEFWRRYVVVWTRWNHTRVVLGVLSIALYAQAL
jgi:uncharacterized membrane protein